MRSQRREQSQELLTAFQESRLNAGLDSVDWCGHGSCVLTRSRLSSTRQDAQELFVTARDSPE